MMNEKMSKRVCETEMNEKAGKKDCLQIFKKKSYSELSYLIEYESD